MVDLNRTTKDLLDEEIRQEIDELSNLEIGSDKYTAAVESLAKLYKLRIDEMKNDNDKEDEKCRIQEEIKDRFFKFGIAAAEIVLPLIFYGIWMRRGLEFEKNGTFTSQVFRGLFSRFRPTKK